MTEDEMSKWRGNSAMWKNVDEHDTKMEWGKSSNKARRLSEVPASMDWRTKGGVNPIKNQGQCGSCYTFGSTAVIESAVFNNGFDLPNLSEQQVVSCPQAYGNQGCNGGRQPRVFEYVHVNYQVPLVQYPYISGGGTTYACNTTAEKNGQIYTTAMALVTQNNTE